MPAHFWQWKSSQGDTGLSSLPFLFSAQSYYSGWEIRSYPADFLRKMSNIAQTSTGWKWGKSLFCSLKLNVIFSLESRSNVFMKRNCCYNPGGSGRSMKYSCTVSNPHGPQMLTKSASFHLPVALQPGWYLPPQCENFCYTRSCLPLVTKCLYFWKSCPNIIFEESVTYVSTYNV